MSSSPLDLFAGSLKQIEQVMTAKSNELTIREEAVSARETKLKLLLDCDYASQGQILIRVGTQIFYTTATILTSIKDSYFSGMLNPNFAVDQKTQKNEIKKEKLDDDDDDVQEIKKVREYFIPRDPDSFRYVLEYLTYGELFSEIDQGTLKKLAVDADYYMLPKLKICLLPKRGISTSRLCSWTSEQKGTTIYRKWTTPVIESKTMGIELQTDQEKFLSPKGGVYRVTVRINGSSSGANSDHISLHLNGSGSGPRAFVGMNTGYYSSFHLNEIVTLAAGQFFQVYQIINSNNLTGQNDNALTIELIE